MKMYSVEKGNKSVGARTYLLLVTSDQSKAFELAEKSAITPMYPEIKKVVNDNTTVWINENLGMFGRVTEWEDKV